MAWLTKTCTLCGTKFSELNRIALDKRVQEHRCTPAWVERMLSRREKVGPYRS